MPVIKIKPQVSPELERSSTIHDLKIPYNVHGSAPRIMWVFDQNTTQGDTMLPVGSRSRELHDRCLQEARNVYRVTARFGYMYFNYPCVVPQKNATGHDKANYGRFLKALAKFRPDHIVFVGNTWKNAGSELADEPYSLLEDTNAYGLAIPGQYQTKDGSVKCLMFTCPSLRYLTSSVCYTLKARQPYLIGQAVRAYAAALQGRSLAQIDSEWVTGAPARPIKSLEHLRKLLRKMESEKVLSFDTETDGLGKVTVRMQTLQVGLADGRVFVVPWHRPDCPFDPEEFEQARTLLRDFFESHRGEHLYANGNFDLNVLACNLGVRLFACDLYDVVAGEVAFDENTVLLQDLAGSNSPPLSLGAICQRYGFMGYLTNAIGKANRVGVGLLEFTEPVLNYLKYDVAVLHEIRRCQLEMAARIGYKSFHRVVTKVIGEQIQCFSLMNQNGQLVDMDYLWQLNAPTSSLLQEIENFEKGILESAPIKEAGELLNESTGRPRTGFFGRIQAVKFDLAKRQHMRLLFERVLNLEPLRVGKSGEPSFDKNFLAHYAPDNKVCSDLIELGARRKLHEAFATGLLRSVTTDPDCRIDNRIRSTYVYTDVVTGRVSSRNPNMQQIPSRGKLSKIIKRIFVSRPGSLIFKVDYRAHEVRGLVLVSGDTKLGDLFRRAKAISDQYLKEPTPENKKLLDTEGDIHMVNAAFFFQMPITEITKNLRDAVKAVVFGLIYGRQAPSMAEATGNTLETIEKVMAAFFNRFDRAALWLKTNVEKARASRYVESPLGRRRRLWPYLLPGTDKDREYRSKAKEIDRVAGNSPIQGMGSDFGFKGARLMAELAYRDMKERGADRMPLRLQNMVHDATISEVDYDYVLRAPKVIDHALTTGLQKRVTKQMGLKWAVDLEIEFEIGPCESHMFKWDRSPRSFQEIIVRSLLWQQYEGGHDLDAIKQFRKMFKGKELINPEDYIKEYVKE